MFYVNGITELAFCRLGLVSTSKLNTIDSIQFFSFPKALHSKLQLRSALTIIFNINGVLRSTINDSDVPWKHQNAKLQKINLIISLVHNLNISLVHKIEIGMNIYYAHHAHRPDTHRLFLSSQK
jgi:hypothetical protein